MSLTSRLNNIDTFYDRGSERNSFFSTDKDRLENVLLCIFGEAALKSAFFEFLSDRCMENLLSFRDEVEYLKSIETQEAPSISSPTNRLKLPIQPFLHHVGSDKGIAGLASSIYARYINRTSPKHIQIDYLTIQGINNSLKMSSSGKITEKNPVSIQKAFDEAISKVCHQLIYDHLAHFLMSKHYTSANKPIQPVALDEDVDDDNREELFDTIIAHPVCSYFFKNYLRQLPDCNRRFPVIEQLECLQEMLDFGSSTENLHRAQRCKLIIQRYGRVAYGIQELILMRNELSSCGERIPDKYGFPDPGMFHLVYYRLSNILVAEHLHGFITSRFYNELEAFHSKQEVFMALDRFKVGKLGTKLIESSGVPDFQLDDNTIYELALKDPLGVSLFKRFAVSHFMEENIDFFLEVKYFKEEDYSTPPAGSAIYYDEFTSIEEMRFMRAMKICEKYIEVGARMQINVSTAMRENILRNLTASEEHKIDLNLFDDAIGEVKKLMKHNLWIKFVNTDSYNLFLQKCCKKWTTKMAKQVASSLADGMESSKKSQESDDRKSQRSSCSAKAYINDSVGKISETVQAVNNIIARSSDGSEDGGEESKKNQVPTSGGMSHAITIV